MKLSASRLDLASSCRYAFRQDVPEPESSGSMAASIGTSWHAVVADALSRGYGVEARACADALASVGLGPEHVEHLLAMRPYDAARAVAKHITARPEIAYAYDTATGTVTELGQGLGRDYQASATEITGTADVVWSETDPIVGELVWVVRDWKTGRQANVAPAHENKQLAFLALCLAKLYGPEKVRVELAFVAENGEIRIDAHYHEAFELLEFEAELCQIFARIPESEPAPGHHCADKYCPCRASCPATQAALAKIEPSEPDYPIAGAITGPEHASYVLHRIKAVRAACDAAYTALRAYATEHGPFDTAPGKAWGPTMVTLEFIEADSTEQLVEALKVHLPEQEARGCAHAMTTKSELEKAAKACAEPRKGAQKLRDIMDVLRCNKLIRESTSTTYTEFKK